jgi:hypothetical protein
MFALPCQPQYIVLNSVGKALAGCARRVDNLAPSGAEPRGYRHPLWTDTAVVAACALGLRQTSGEYAARQMH